MDKIESIELHVGHIVGVVVTPIIEQVIEIARQARSTGKSKVDAVRQIYPKIVDADRKLTHL
jgi:hypothetical protein